MSHLRAWTVERFRRLSLAEQLLLASLVILLANMLAIGWWVGQQIELGVLHRTAAATALFVDSYLEPVLQPLTEQPDLSPGQVETLQRLLNDTDMGRDIVSFKIWGPGARVLFATDDTSIGQTFPPSPGLQRSWRGEVTSDISDLDEEENVSERASFSRLMEVYSPVRETATDRIIAVAEFYQPLGALQDEINGAQTQSWLVVGLGTLLTYVLLVGLVRRGSNTIQRQQGELQGHVAQLTTLLAQNEELHQRVQRAARRTTELNEQYLRRISAELHDGPAQDIALALLRLDSQTLQVGGAVDGPSGDAAAAEIERIHGSLARALQELRAVSAGLRLPELERLSLADTVRRVADAHARRTATDVDVGLGPIPEHVPLRVKITVYRLIQEALSNAYRHGGGADQQVRVHQANQHLIVEVADAGPGFDPVRVPSNGHLGLAGMRERVESQGGQFAIVAGPGRGTEIRAVLALDGEDENHD
jgi:signal transduction histidine kinase